MEHNESLFSTSMADFAMIEMLFLSSNKTLVTMGFLDFFVTKILGYDILEEKEKLETSLENARRSMALLSQQNKEFHKTVEANKREINRLAKSLNDKVSENDNLLASLDAKQMGIDQLTNTINSKSQEIAALRENEANLKESLGKNQRAMISMTQLNKELQDSIDVNKNKIEFLSNQVDEQVAQNAHLSASVEAKVTEIGKLNNTLGAKNKELEALSEKVDYLDAQRKSKQGTIMNHVKKINNLFAELEELKQKSEQHNLEHKELEQLKENYTSLCDLKNELEAKCEGLLNESRTLQADNKKLIGQIALLEQEITNSPEVKQKDLKELEKQIQKNEETIQTKETELERLNNEKDDMKSQFDAICKELENVRVEKDKISECFSDLEKRNMALQDKYDALSKDHDDLQQRLNVWESQTREGAKIEEPKETDEHNLGKEANTSNGISEKTGEKTTDDTPIKEKPVTVVKKSNSKSKEEEAIEKSGNSIVDFPLIVNDSNKNILRTIKYVFDDNNKKVYANEFFERSAEEIAQVARNMSEAEISGKTYWSCGLCLHRVKIAYRTYKNKESLFFIHATRDHYCPWLNKTTKSDDAKKRKMLYWQPMNYNRKKHVKPQ